MGDTQIGALVGLRLIELRAAAEAHLQAGRLREAAEISYGQIPDLEREWALVKGQLEDESLDDQTAQRCWVRVWERTGHRLVFDLDGVTWAASPLADFDPTAQDSADEDDHPGLGWMRVGEALSLPERRDLLVARVRAALKAGDLPTARQLEDGPLEQVEQALEHTRSFRLVRQEGTRLVLADDETTWVAAPLG